mgnify:CR=1 FL=1
MNKKAITAIENKKLLKNIKKNNNIKFIYKNIQYREAIIEILKKEKDLNEIIKAQECFTIKNLDVDGKDLIALGIKPGKDIGIIFISEDIPGEISIEELINEIKLINKKIEIIFFLNRKNKNKEEKLKKIKVNKIYYIKKINNKFKNNEKNIKNKIIAIYGEPQSGKTTIANLLLIYLIKNDKKILLLNLNKKIEKTYLDLLKKENINYNNKERKIKLNKNISFYFNVVQIPKKTKLINKKDIVKNLIKYYIKKYDYILIDIGKDSDEFVKEEILKNSDKRIIVGNNNLLKIKEVRKLAKNNKKIEKYSNNKKIIAIQNKVSIYSFSFLINKYILKKSANIYKIFNNKNYIDLLKKILEGKKLKINKLMKIKIKNIINKI